jgi:hypothetical protein
MNKVVICRAKKGDIQVIADEIPFKPVFFRFLKKNYHP